MGLKLNKEVGWIVSHAWSFRFLVLAAAFTGAEALLPLLSAHQPLPPRLFAAVTFLIVVAAMVSRTVVQQRPPQFFTEVEVPESAKNSAATGVPVVKPNAPASPVTPEQSAAIAGALVDGTIPADAKTVEIGTTVKGATN